MPLRLEDTMAWSGNSLFAFKYFAAVTIPLDSDFDDESHL